MTEMLLPLADAAPELTPVAGEAGRFGGRWRLVSCRIFNVWRFADLDLDLASGRGLLTGGNGVGKTTGLEALLPYLLDLNPAKLAAGKARPTTLRALMAEGGEKKRVGYLCVTFAAPTSQERRPAQAATRDESEPAATPGPVIDPGEMTYGVRLTFSAAGTPPVRVTPFRVPGRLGQHAALAAGAETLSAEVFAAAVSAGGGVVFDSEEDYVSDLALRLLRGQATDLRLLTDRIRQVRNPSLLAEISSEKAAEALRDCLPGVDAEVVAAAAAALASTDETRAAFARDAKAAELLEDFARVWSGHARDTVTKQLEALGASETDVRRARSEVTTSARLSKESLERREALTVELSGARDQVGELTATIGALENSDAYRAAGRLDDLERTAQAQEATVKAELRSLEAAASAASAAHAQVRSGAEQLALDLTAHDEAVAALAPEAALVAGALAYASAPQAVLTVGDWSLSPGGGTRLTVDQAALQQAQENLAALAARQEARAAAAQGQVTEHGPVATAHTAGQRASREVADLVERGEQERLRLRVREDKARAARDASLALLRSWTQENEVLAAGTGDDGGADEAAHGDGGELPASEPEAPAADAASWDTDTVDELAQATPAEVLAQAQEFSQVLQGRVARARAAVGVQREQATTAASALGKQAGELRSEARELRSGKLRPLPRPAWAGAGDDEQALGTAIEWRGQAPEQASLVEAALAAAGVLGATLLASGASSGEVWTLRAQTDGPSPRRHLGQLLQAAAGHPLAAEAEAVLRQIAVTDTSAEGAGAPEAAAALSVGLDGSFRIGPARGQAAQLAGAGSEHIGARARLAAALAQAALMEQQAEELDQQALVLTAKAAALQVESQQLAAALRQFPSTGALGEAEKNRQVSAGRVLELEVDLDAAQSKEHELLELAAELLRTWQARTRDAGLPIVLAELEAALRGARERAQRLREREAPLRRLISRLAALAAAATVAQQRSEALDGALAQARAAAGAAAAGRHEVDAMREAVGSDVRDVVSELARARAALGAARTAEQALEPRERDALNVHASASARAEVAHQQLAAVSPQASAQRAMMRALLAQPGVSHAVFGDAAIAAEDVELAAQLQEHLARQPTAATKTVRERYDAVRAALAGLWSLDPGEDTGALATFVLTYKDEAFSPTAGAAKAQAVAQAAKAAMEHDEEAALRDFIIGRLPDAIGLAWTNLNDWVREVNTKMRSASASSGVGVKVEVNLQDGLAAAERTIYELACKTSAASRTPEQARTVGAALRTLIDTVHGDTMADRVAAAVDIRDWVDVRYVILRAGKPAERWGRKTGLSGGERRLVVLAPMLAAIAAACERFGDEALRLCVLDEVPAEVDEAGREGLARYLAELDLDLLCSSYLWDGAPGAWDGIDVHELEAGSDGTVIGWHTKVRGPQPWPDPSLAP